MILKQKMDSFGDVYDTDDITMLDFLSTDLTATQTESSNNNNFLLSDSINNNNNNNERLLFNSVLKYHTILIVLSVLITFILIAILILIMVYIYLKRRNSYKKTTENDLASLTNSSLINTSSIIASDLTLTTTTIATSSAQLTNNLTTTKSSTSDCTIGGSSSSSSSICSLSLSLNKTPLKEICISIPVAKPSLNESKPQLNIENNMKAKTLLEKRGSNHSLTLSLNPVKKKSLNSPSKDCSTIEYLSKQSRLLYINDIIELTKSKVDLYNEYNLIPFNHPETSVPGTGIKNRYKTILPNEFSRVKLADKSNEPFSSYINANHISGFKGEPQAYIASQGPMSHTVHDFWSMIWHECVPCIVMLTKLIERNKNKCELYIPDECSKPVEYDNITVTVKQINYCQDYEIRQLIVTNEDETRIIYHYWYTEWPDHNLPENPNNLIQLIKQVESCRKYEDGLVKGPVLVHCSAGVGRTGCFVALSIGIRQLDVENVVDILQVVSRLRIERGGMVQTLEQYEFLYQVFAYYCIYYKKFPSRSTSSSLSPSHHSVVSSPSLKSPTSSTHFTFNTQIIQ